jgi:hypothetical protein
VKAVLSSERQLITTWTRGGIQLVQSGLAPVFGRLRMAHQGSPQEHAEPHEDPVGQLKRLAELHDVGALSDDEFETAKQRIIGAM